MTVDPRETLAAHEEALRARERLGRGLGTWFVVATVAIVVAVVVLILWLAI